MLLVVLSLQVLRLYRHFKVAGFLIDRQRECRVASSDLAILPFFHFPALGLLLEKALERLPLTLEFLMLRGMSFLGRWRVDWIVGLFGLLNQLGDTLGNLLDEFPDIF